MHLHTQNHLFDGLSPDLSNLRWNHLLSQGVHNSSPMFSSSLLKKKAESTTFWASRVRLKVSAGHMLFMLVLSILGYWDHILLSEAMRIV